jgi:hypothetical protein
VLPSRTEALVAGNEQSLGQARVRIASHEGGTSTNIAETQIQRMAESGFDDRKTRSRMFCDRSRISAICMQVKGTYITRVIRCTSAVGLKNPMTSLN